MRSNSVTRDFPSRHSIGLQRPVWWVVWQKSYSTMLHARPILLLSWWFSRSNSTKHTRCVENRIFNRWFTIFSYSHTKPLAKKLTTLADACHVTKIQHEANSSHTHFQTGRRYAYRTRIIKSKEHYQVMDDSRRPLVGAPLKEKN